MHMNNDFRIFLVGDSTMKTYDNTEAPQTGWGQFIKDYFTKDVPIFNYALGGRSTRTFMEEGHLDKVFGEIKESDYLFVQMGHNDSSKNKPERYTEPNTTYKKNLKIYIKGTIERNAKPILITPVARLKYKNEQFITDLTEYCIAMKEVAQEESIPLIDLNTKSLHYYSSLGYEEAMKLFMVSVKGSDYTHFTELGGVEIARLVAEGIKE